MIKSAGVLKHLIYFARSNNADVRREACKSLAIFCENFASITPIVEIGAGISPLITVLSEKTLSDNGIVNVVKVMAEHVR